MAMHFFQENNLVAQDSVYVEYVNAMLPQHEKPTLKNRQILDSYSIVKKSGTTSVNQKIQSTEMPNWIVFPNPVLDELTIVLNKPVEKEAIVQIISLEGRIVKQIEQNGRLDPGNSINIKINDSNGNRISKGIYVVRVISDGNISSYQKIVVN
jgi:hypothetical protein